MSRDRDHLGDLELALGLTESGGLPGTRSDRPLGERDAALLGALGSVSPAAEPPADLFSRIEAEIEALPERRTRTVRAGDGEWVLRAPKIWKKLLSEDASTGRTVYLLRCEPGAVIPEHRHARAEYVFVIEGSFEVDGVVVRAGDFQSSISGSLHAEIRSPEGCLALVAA